MDSDIEVARASRDDACEALLNLRKSRDELLQQAVDAKAEFDEAKRTCDQIFYLDCDIDAVLEFSEKRLIGFEDTFDQAIEQLIEQHAAVKKASAEHTKKEEAYLNALKKSRLCLEAPSGAALPKRPGDDTKAPGGQFNCGEVRYLIAQVVMNRSLGRETAINVLDREGHGSKSVSDMKPEHFDLVYERCQRLLADASLNPPTDDPSDKSLKGGSK